jgi:hypothetical protein
LEANASRTGSNPTAVAPEISGFVGVSHLARSERCGVVTGDRLGVAILFVNVHKYRGRWSKGVWEQVVSRRTSGNARGVYNRHRPHGSLAGQPPITRLPFHNLTGKDRSSAAGAVAPASSVT